MSAHVPAGEARGEGPLREPRTALLPALPLIALALIALALFSCPAQARARSATTSTVHAPLVQAGDPTAFRADAAGSCRGTDAGGGMTMQALSTDPLGREARAKLTKKLTQAVRSMKTVKSARVVRVSSLKITASKKRDRAIARLFGNIVNFHPEYFYVGNILRLSKSPKGRYEYVELGYAYRFSALGKKLAACERGLANLLSWVPEQASDLEKVKAVHDWLVRNCTYDANADYEKDRWSPYNVYGALVNHKPVCQGYSLAFLLAMRQLGIEATCVGQYVGKQGHMWNRVRVDGSWYHVDLTYDDPLTNVTLPSYRDRGFYATPDTTYFMKSDAWWREHAAYGGWHRDWFPRGEAATDTSYDDVSTWPAYGARARFPSRPTFAIVDLDEVATGTTVALGSGAARASYRVTSASSVTYRRCLAPAKATEAKVPKTVTIARKRFSVTGIARGAFQKRPRVRILAVKTGKLAKKSTRECLAGSKVRRVKAPKASRRAYRACFAKGNSGRSVKLS